MVEIEENLWRGLDEEAEQRDMTVEQAFVEILGMRRKGK